ncbi:MAG TPA: hypothetical protein VKF37_06675 [Chloroflexota bacterium]|nr:hypothetical protein [Chloroflexota bacterium]
MTETELLARIQQLEDENAQLRERQYVLGLIQQGAGCGQKAADVMARCGYSPETEQALRLFEAAAAHARCMLDKEMLSAPQDASAPTLK